jgi:hypothetical protein
LEKRHQLFMNALFLGWALNPGHSPGPKKAGFIKG